MLSADKMLAVTRSLDRRFESPTLVVATTGLKLALVVLVWLVALVPAALAALTLLAVNSARSALDVDAPDNAPRA